MTNLYESLAEANIDYQFFLDRYGENTIYERMLKGFLKDTTFIKLREAYSHEDRRETVVYATSLLGTAQYLGFADFCEILKPVSEVYLADDKKQWDDFVERCEKEYNRIREVLLPFFED